VTYTWDGAKWVAQVAGGGAPDKIEEGNTSAEVIDTGSDGRFVVTTEGSRRMAVYSDGNISIGPRTTTPGELLALETASGSSLSLGHSGQNRWKFATDTTSLAISDLTGGERIRIRGDGVVLIGATANTVTDSGFFSQQPTADYYLGLVNTSSNSAVPVLHINRQTSDGTLVSFRQANTLEGTISVSGTTVTYGGGHIARWSQLPNAENPSTLLKGTVLSNLDEMCEWGEEDNEQLNRTKVSDVEGDPNVAGVFVSTSPSEDGPLDFFCAMTGDMIIRIAEGVTVQRGDLLMSAGDGTAKPQDDDIIRSKTIAKVTSTVVSCTHPDGSYCVPCVLMAC
jgi:hypothetical protein